MPRLPSLLLALISLLILAACLERTAAPAPAPAPAAPAAQPATAWRPALPPQVSPGAAPATATSEWAFVVRNANDGPQITFAGSLLSTGSPIFCTNPDWSVVHFNMGRDPFTSASAPGRLALASDPASPSTFILDSLLLEATGPQAMRLSVDGHLTAAVPAMIEYIPLCIPASLLAGAVIESELGDRLVVGEAPVELQRPVRNLRLRRPGGSLVLSVAEGVGLTILDRRVKSYHGRQVFLIMAGAFSEHPRLAKDERFRHVLDLTLPDGFSVRPELPRIAPVAGVVALPAQPASLVAPSRALCPQPRSVRLGEGRVALPAELVLSVDGLEDAGRIANIFADALAVEGAARPLRLGNGGWVRLRRIEAPAPERWDYHRLSITGKGVEVAAVSPAAASYALGTLAQLVEAGSVRQAEIEDWSDFRYRGLHVIACDGDALKVQSSVIRRIMVPLRFNQILLECQFVRWPSQPAIHHPQGMPYDEFKALVGFADERFIASIPCLSAYGHCEYLFQNKANLDIAEDPVAPYAYDVSNPRTWEVMRGILGDLRAAVPKAPWFHLGHDEVTMRGRYPHRPANLGKSLGELLTRDLAFYQEWATSNGTALMLWSDYLAGRSHRVPAVKADLQAVIGRLDPSTVVAMWEYDATSDYAECEPFLSRGVPVFGATGEEDVRNLTTFARYAKAKHLPGMMHTTWTGYLGSVSAVYRWPRKLWPYIQAGLSFWEAEAPLISRQQPSRATAMYDRMVGDLYPEVRRIAPGDRLQPIGLGSVADHSLAEPGGFVAGPLRTPQGGYFVLPGTAAGAAGVVLANGASLRLPIGRPARAISFLWAGLAADPAVRDLGSLTLAGGRPIPITVRRQLGNLLHGLVTPGDAASGALLTRSDDEQNFSIARPVFSPAGRYVLWQYDLELGGAQVEAVTITAARNAELILAGVSLVE